MSAIIVEICMLASLFERMKELQKWRIKNTDRTPELVEGFVVSHSVDRSPYRPSHYRWEMLLKKRQTCWSLPRKLINNTTLDANQNADVKKERKKDESVSIIVLYVESLCLWDRWSVLVGSYCNSIAVGERSVLDAVNLGSVDTVSVSYFEWCVDVLDRESIE